MRRTSGYVFPGVLWLELLFACVCVSVGFSAFLVQYVRSLLSLALLHIVFPQTFSYILTVLHNRIDPLAR